MTTSNLSAGFLLAVAVTSLLGCQSMAPTGVAAASAAQATEPAALSEQRMAGRVVASASGHTAQAGSAALCTVPAQTVDIMRFESGRYRVAALCEGMQFAAQVWVDAAWVDYDDSALAPALVRVHETANVRVNMAYHGSRTFCDGTQPSSKCLISEPLYGKARCYAAPATAQALARAAALLAKQDPSLSLNLLDCYRPMYVQQRMFALVPGTKWVAAPRPPRYGGHNRAVAIDLTLSRHGLDLDMGIAFDAFDELSAYTGQGTGLTTEQQTNRNTLRHLMQAAGFRPYDAEWWHFGVLDATPPLNLPL